MAKAREIPGLSAEIPYGEAAARVLEVRLAELIERSEGVLDVGEEERLHDMRVASRRLRAVLEVFRPCFPKREYRVALREIKAVADALGERRDRDVAIAALERFAAGIAAPDRPGIRSLVGMYRTEQSGANEALEPFVAEVRLRELARRVEALAAAARAAATAGGGGAPE